MIKGPIIFYHEVRYLLKRNTKLFQNLHFLISTLIMHFLETFLHICTRHHEKKNIKVIISIIVSNLILDDIF